VGQRVVNPTHRPGHKDALQLQGISGVSQVRQCSLPTLALTLLLAATLALTGAFVLVLLLSSPALVVTALLLIVIVALVAVAILTTLILLVLVVTSHFPTPRIYDVIVVTPNYAQ
jgi:hypothetical protein